MRFGPAFFTGLATATLAIPVSSPAENRSLDAQFAIAGQLDGMDHQSQKAGIPFQVGFREIGYNGQVTKAVLEQKQADKATLWLSFRNLRLTINKTTVNGTVGSATCGPLQLVLGNQRDLWIAYDLVRQEENGQAKLMVQGTRFQLPNNNWAIGAPAWVRGTGLLNQNNVTSGLREGLAQNRARIENRLRLAAPKILTALCQQSAKDPKSAERLIVDAVRGGLLSAPVAGVIQQASGTQPAAVRQPAFPQQGGVQTAGGVAPNSSQQPRPPALPTTGFPQTGTSGSNPQRTAEVPPFANSVNR